MEKFIIEAIGRQLEIYNISEYIAEYMSENIEERQQNGGINDGHSHKATFPIRKTENIIHETKISFIEIDLLYNKTNDFKISGSFKSNKTRLADGGNYNIYIEVNIENDDRTTAQLKENIESVVSHELNHAFVFIKKINLQSKSKAYNASRKITAFGFQKTPELKEFMDMFYMSIPEEIQARVQQTASEIKHTNGEEHVETMAQLMRFNPLNDARRMMGYNLNNIKKLDSDTLDTFVKHFNLNVQAFSKDLKIKPITNTNSFFEYWLNIINQGGVKLFKKITKLVADKHNTTLQEAYISLVNEESLLLEVTARFFEHD